MSEEIKKETERKILEERKRELEEKILDTEEKIKELTTRREEIGKELKVAIEAQIDMLKTLAIEHGIILEM